MTRAEIEKMEFLGAGWDCALPGPIETLRFKKYKAPDGTLYALLDWQDKYSKGTPNTGWTSWEPLDG
jgi:hypothetical protein